MANPILILSNSMWSLYNFRRSLAVALGEYGRHVVLAAPFDGFEDRLHDAGFEVRHLPLDRKGTHPFSELKTAVGLFRLFRRRRPAAVLSFTIKPNIYASLVGRLLRVPVIPNITGLGEAFSRAGLLRAMVIALYRFSFAAHRTVFFQNREDRTVFLRHRIVTDEQAVRLPGSGVDCARFRAAVPARPFRRFLFLGRMLYNKGVFEYLGAANQVRRRFPTAEFRLLGPCDAGNPEGISAAELRDRCAQAQAVYLGATDDVRPHVAEADCVVLPSYYNEGVPRSLLEAAAMGKPVITTDWPGCRDAVEDDVTGFLCRPRDAADLARQMERMIGLSQEERVAMGRAARLKMEREFDERIVIEAYRKALAGLGPAAGKKIP